MAICKPRRSRCYWASACGVSVMYGTHRNRFVALGYAPVAHEACAAIPIWESRSLEIRGTAAARGTLPSKLLTQPINYSYSTTVFSQVPTTTAEAAHITADMSTTMNVDKKDKIGRSIVSLVNKCFRHTKKTATTQIKASPARPRASPAPAGYIPIFNSVATDKSSPKAWIIDTTFTMSSADETPEVQSPGTGASADKAPFFKCHARRSTHDGSVEVKVPVHCPRSCCINMTGALRGVLTL